MADSKTPQSETHDILLAKVRRLRLLRVPVVVAMLLLGFHATRTAIAHYRAYQNNTLSSHTPAEDAASDNPADKPAVHVAQLGGQPKRAVSASPDLTQSVLQAVDSETNRREPSDTTRNKATPVKGPIVGSPELADAISEAVVWVASRALCRPVRTEVKALNRSSAKEASTLDEPLDADLVSIVNPLGSGVEIHYLVNDKVFHLGPGQRHGMKNEGPVQVRFHRGGTFGEAILLLTPGRYDFVATDHGWDLVRRESRDVRGESP